MSSGPTPGAAEVATTASGAAGLLLFPGAGSSRDHHTLLALEAALAPLAVERADFPYRKAGRRAPDRAPVLVATVVEEARRLAARLGVGTDRIVAGGRSMGGRMCSMAVAEGLTVAGLVLISYPLHPPGRPDRMRRDHFPLVASPTLFVSGTRDPFGTVDELEAATAELAGPVRHVWIEGGRHPLDRADDAIVGAVAAWLSSVG